MKVLIPFGVKFKIYLNKSYHIMEYLYQKIEKRDFSIIFFPQKSNVLLKRKPLIQNHHLGSENTL